MPSFSLINSIDKIMIATFSSRYVGQDSQEKADPHLFLGTPKAQMNSCNTSWDRIHMATFYTGRDTSCIEKEVLVNVKMIIAKDKIHVNAVWSLQRLYLPFAQLFGRMLFQKNSKYCVWCFYQFCCSISALCTVGQSFTSKEILF